jgi:hypothetical protein
MSSNYVASDSFFFIVLLKFMAILFINWHTLERWLLTWYERKTSVQDNEEQSSISI